MKTSFWWSSVLGLAFAAVAARAEIRSDAVVYKDGETALEGWVVYDDAIAGPRPGVLVVHQWLGLTDYEKRRSEMLAKLGYVAFAVDIYGQGIRPKNPQEAREFATKYRADRPLLRRRVNLGFEQLKKFRQVDTARTAAIGYCFGGTTVLELARSGADVRGVISFHGGLNTPTPADASNIKGKVLALHGADDPFVPPAEEQAFEEEMRQGKVDWQLVAYGGAVHSFTDWNAGSDNARGAAYNERADKRSWKAMTAFFDELFAAK